MKEIYLRIKKQVADFATTAAVVYFVICNWNEIKKMYRK